MEYYVKPKISFENLPGPRTPLENIKYKVDI